MKKLLLLLLLAPLIFFSSCLKKQVVFDPAAQAKVDDQLIQTYLVANPNLPVVKDSSGLYYQVINPGTGTHPSPKSVIVIDETTTYLSGEPIDAQTQNQLNMADLIQGWKIGIPQVGAGGKVLLIIPSGLAYGPYQMGNVRPNSILLSTITLDSIVSN